MTAPRFAAARAEIEAFERGEADATDFDHAAHVRIAWCYLICFDVLEATCRFSRALERLTVRLGAADKFHATVSGFFMLLIAERIAHRPVAGWAAFRDANPDLFADAGALLRARYTPARLSSALARGQFLLPDRAAAAGPPQGAATT